MKYPRAFLTIVLLLLVLNNIAQTTGRYEIGIKIGAFVYEGDLTPNAVGDMKTTSCGIAVHITRIINEQLSVRFNFSHGKLKGDDSKYSEPLWRRQRNLKFSSRINELSLTGEWNVLSLLPNEAGIINFTPYMIGGVGLAFLNIRRDWSGFNAAHFVNEANVTNGLAEDINTQPPKSILVFPIGVGVRYGINSKLSLTFESVYRQTFNDYIDGFSKAANPGRDDHYHTHLIGLVYSFGKKSRLDCPPVK